MRKTLNPDDAALVAARNLAQRARPALGEAVGERRRRGAAAASADGRPGAAQPLRGRFALLPARDGLTTPRHVRDLMERDGI